MHHACEERAGDRVARLEHEAWNGSDRTRVILLFEVWRPELTLEERALVSAMFEAIDAYNDEPAPKI